MKKIIYKTCCQCNNLLTIGEFHNDVNAKDGLNPMCKTCVKNKQLTTKEALKEYQIKWRHAHPSYQIEYYKNHKTKGEKNGNIKNN